MRTSRESRPPSTFAIPTISVNAIESEQIYWLSTPICEPLFKDVDPDVIEDLFLLFKHLYSASLAHLHQYTKIKHCPANIDSIDPTRESSVSIVYTAIQTKEVKEK